MPPETATPIQTESLSAPTQAFNAPESQAAVRAAPVAVDRPYSPPIIKIGDSAPDQILEFQQSRALKKNPEYMRAMGLRYLTGNGVPKDEAKGKDLLQQAANKGDFPSKNKLKEFAATQEVKEEQVDCYAGKLPGVESIH